jgi:hypothetical protein
METHLHLDNGYSANKGGGGYVPVSVVWCVAYVSDANRYVKKARNVAG